MPNKTLIQIPQLKRELEGHTGDNLLTLLRSAGVPVAHSCAGEGVCGTCRVRVSSLLVSTQVPPPSAQEKELARRHRCAAGTRFACLVEILPDAGLWEVETDYW